MRSISRRPLRYIVNTNEREEHIGGNEAIAAAGSTIPFRPPKTSASRTALGNNRASVISFLTVFHRMSAPTGQVAPRPEDAWPDNTYSTPQKKLYFNDEPVLIMHVPSNTDGNSIVHFRTADVVSVGGPRGPDRLSLHRREGRRDYSSDRSTSLNRLIDLTVPDRKSEGGTLVIPGHGRLADQPDVVYYQQMVAIVRDRIKDMIARGMTLEQVKAARPTRDYDTRYGWIRAPGRPTCSSRRRIEASEVGEKERFMKRTALLLLAAVVVLGAAGRVFAHHSFTAAYDNTKRVEVEGVVKEFVWRNPHSFVTDRRHDNDGKTETWNLEWGSSSQLSAAKYPVTRTTIKAAIASSRPANRGATRGQAPPHLQHQAADRRMGVGRRRRLDRSTFISWRRWRSLRWLACSSSAAAHAQGRGRAARRRSRADARAPRPRRISPATGYPWWPNTGTCACSCRRRASSRCCP